MYTCSCTVGKTFNKCDAANHIRALDYRAATFEAMGEIDRARLDAEWLLELAPWLPEVCCWPSPVVVLGMFAEVF
jgi:hypothetical protein